MFLNAMYVCKAVKIRRASYFDRALAIIYGNAVFRYIFSLSFQKRLLHKY
jgi:hypothetical protein